MFKKACKHNSGVHKNLLHRCDNDEKYGKSLSDIGWNEKLGSLVEYRRFSRTTVMNM